ncbi:arginase family protein [Cupriavidus basilensis]
MRIAGTSSPCARQDGLRWCMMPAILPARVNPLAPPVQGLAPTSMRWSPGIAACSENQHTHSRGGQDAGPALGGDHRLAVGSVSAVALTLPRPVAGRLVVLWPDAACRRQHRVEHADRQYVQRQCLVALMPVRRRSHAADNAFGRPAAGGVAAGNPAKSAIRSVDAQGEAVASACASSEVRSTCAISMSTACARTTEQALAVAVDDDTHLHVSFDVDFIDVPASAGQVSARRCAAADPPTVRRNSLHGDDRGHGTAVVAGRDGTQSRLRCAQRDGKACTRTSRKSLLPQIHNRLRAR